MFKEWGLGGLKSFGEETPVPLSPVSLFAGANSSGKSTLLQGALLIKQTLQYGSESKNLMLNGPLIKVGTLPQVLHEGMPEKALTISFKLSPKERDTMRPTPWSRALNRIQIGKAVAIKEIECRFTWIPSPRAYLAGSTTVDQINGKLRDAKICVTLQEREGEAEAVRTISYRLPNDFEWPDDTASDRATWYEVGVDTDSEVELVTGRPEGKVDSMTLNYFLPAYLAVKYNKKLRYAQDFAQALITPSSFLSKTQIDKEIVSPATAKIINDWLVEKNLRSFLFDIDVPVPATVINTHFVSATRGNGIRRLTGIVPSPSEVFVSDELAQAIARQIYHEKKQDEDSDTAFDFAIPRAISASIEYITSYFKQGVRYLGPLRNEPKPVYPLEALEDTTNVGYRGEHTAAVLNLHGSTRVLYIPPPDDALGSFPAGRTAELRHAVVDWLKYLGVATDVIATDAGVFGNQLRVGDQHVERTHDLNNVGVGVSQVLPVIVSCLLAPQTSALIFEQPELHLHPKVQARLGDFFYSIAMSEKQCIIETHSEYLVERLRLRIAQNDSDNLRDLLSLYFAQRVGGRTEISSVELTRYGAVLDWPDDFFDQSSKESGRILDAAMAKRKRERES